MKSILSVIVLAASVLTLNAKAADSVPQYEQAVGRDTRVKALVRVLKNIDFCDKDRYQESVTKAGVTKFKMTYLCSNHANTEGQQFITVSGRIYQNGDSVGVEVRKATSEDAATAGE